MNYKDFEELTRQAFETRMKIMNTKGREYSGSEDKFANFKRLAKMQELPAESIWLTYFTKHMDSLTSFIRRRNKGESVLSIDATLSEPIEGRIDDIQNYLDIFRGMIKEQRETEAGLQ
jgi:hypothetical protein